MLGCEHDDHDVGDAGNGQGHEGRIDDGDEEYAGESEGQQQVNQRIGVMGAAAAGVAAARAMRMGWGDCDRRCGRRGHSG